MCSARLSIASLGASAARLDVGLRTRTHEAIDRALTYLSASQQEDWGWEAFGRSHPALTALVVPLSQTWLQIATKTPLS